MKLSIVMPSHNIGTSVKASILNACAMGIDGVEVIIRDNSGNQEKRDFLSRIHEKNCRILSVDECSGAENHRNLLQEASGDFIFVVADDDYANGHALPSIIAELERIQNDPAIIGTTGVFVTDDTISSQFAHFNILDKPTPLERFQAFLPACPSIFQYSPIRAGVLRDVWSFASTLPVYLSYHDWLMNCMFLTHGRMTFIKRYLYQYYNSNWATPELCIETDAHYFRKAGLDASGVRLQWLIAAFEGMQTFMTKYQPVALPPEQRQALGAYWFNHWFPSFLNTAVRQADGAQFDIQAIRIAEKWRVSRQGSLQELLTDIADYFSLSSPEIAQRYYDFWK